MVNGWLMDNGWCTQCHLQDGHHVGARPGKVIQVLPWRRPKRRGDRWTDGDGHQMMRKKWMINYD